jgi:chromatin remodeling complex protein RSC6
MGSTSDEVLPITQQKEVELKNFSSFFSAQNFLLQKKYWKNENEMGKLNNTQKPEKTTKKHSKKAQKPSKTAEKRPKTG